MDISNDPLYKEAAAWRENIANLRVQIEKLYKKIYDLEGKKQRANSEDVKTINTQINELYSEIEASTREMEYGVPITEVDGNG